MYNIFDNNETTDFEFLLSQIGSDVTVNSTVPVRAIISNTTLESNYDDKKISSLSPLRRGDIVYFNEKKYLIISEVNDQRYNNRYKAIMRSLPTRIIVNSESRFYSLNCYINTTDLGITSEKVLTLADGEITINCSKLSMDSDLKLDARFLLNGGAWKVTGIDDFSKPGAVALTCTKDSILPSDDLVNGIAGGLGITVEITNGDFEVIIGTNYQLIWTSTDNAPVRFISSDESVCTVDDSGLVTGLTAGSVTITAYNAQMEQIKDTVTATVKDIPVSYTISITSSSTPGEITKTRTKTYNAVVTQGSATVTEPVTWAIYADDKVNATTLAVITSQSNNSCVVRGDAIGYVQLKAALVIDPTVFTWLQIRIKSAL